MTSLAIDLPFTKRTLANGLDVIVHEDHHVPIVAVNVWYHVGSKNERPGRTGFAHLFEHLMFEGSEHHNAGYFPPLQQAGALLNGSTNTDRTNYWEVVPTSAIDLALWMESDRMGYLLPALTRERFETQRDVVLNERRQNYENRPYGLAMMALSAALYPPDHPYSWMTIGSADDIRAMQLEDVQEFFRTYYHPANASLVLAGDIETERAFDLAEPYFGEIPAGVRPKPVANGAELSSRSGGSCSRTASSCRASTWPGTRRRCSLPATPRWICWATCSPTARRRGSTGRSSTSSGWRSTCRRYQSSREIGSFFLLVATAAPGHSLTEIAARIDDELQRVTDEGPSAEEMERAVAQAEAHFIYRLQTVGGFGGKSDQLNAYNVLQGRPGLLRRRSRALSRRDARVDSGRRRARICSSIGASSSASFRAGSTRWRSRLRGGIGVVTRVDRSRLPDVGPIPGSSFRRSCGTRCGTACACARSSTTACRSSRSSFRSTADRAPIPTGSKGLAAVVADMVDEGTGALTRIDVSDALARIGADYDVDVGADATDFTLTTLTRFAPRGASLLADMVTRPSLRESDFARVRQLRLDRLRQLKDVASAVAEQAFLRLLYGTHPYGHLAIGTMRASGACTPDDVVVVPRARVPACARDARRVRRHEPRRAAAHGRRRVWRLAAVADDVKPATPALGRRASRCAADPGWPSCRARAPRSRSCASDTWRRAATRPTIRRCS